MALLWEALSCTHRAGGRNRMLGHWFNLAKPFLGPGANARKGSVVTNLALG